VGGFGRENPRGRALGEAFRVRGAEIRVWSEIERIRRPLEAGSFGGIGGRRKGAARDGWLLVRTVRVGGVKIDWA